MQHRLILFTGSSPGAGKSTLSRLTFRQVAAHGIPARWLHEDDIVAAFERFVPEMSTGELTPDLFLQASTALVEACRAENATFIVDSYLPGFYYLYGRYGDARIAAFSTDLRTTLNALRPLIIYLRSDVETALMRGVRQRGMQWLENITRYLNGWELPLYGGTPKPLRTIPDVIEFFTRVDRLAVALLAEWPDALILDATQTPVGQLLATILRHLKVEEHSVDHSVSPVELRRYTGVYIPYDDGQASRPLEISLVGDELFVNAYWPAGARLLPEGGTRFHLDGTNHHVIFEMQADGLPYGLTYYESEVTHRYKKVG